MAAKAFFQVGFDAPLFVTLLYLIGQALSLAVYFVSKKLDEYYDDGGSAGDKAEAEDVVLEEEDVEQPQLEVQEKLSPSFSLSASECRRCTGPLTDNEGSVDEEASACEGENVEGNAQMTREQINCDAHNDYGEEVIESAPQRSPPATIRERRNGRMSLAGLQRGSMISEYCSHFRESGESFLEDDNIQAQSSTGADQQQQHRTRVVVDYRGSVTGLTEESKRAVQWVHRIPWYLKPCLTGFFNLLNSAMRWASLVYVAASVAEMLISGLELVLSVVAARIIRKVSVSSYSSVLWQNLCTCVCRYYKSHLFLRCYNCIIREFFTRSFLSFIENGFLSSLVWSGSCYHWNYSGWANRLFRRRTECFGGR